MKNSDTDSDNGKLSRSVLAMILAGGRGKRLAPMTSLRPKSVLPFGGKYRIIDFTLSNCINSGIRRIAILTQRNARPLFQHIHQGWSIMNQELGEYIYVIPTPEREQEDGYQGTAEALQQNLELLMAHSPQYPEYTMILSGDLIYTMNYNRILSYHARNNADVTVATTEIPGSGVSGYDIISVDADNKVVRLEDELSGITFESASSERKLAAMGVYVFNTDRLIELLGADTENQESDHVLGRDIIRAAMQKYRVVAWNFRDNATEESGYWKDIDTVDDYWRANMDLLTLSSPLNLYERDWPIFSTVSQRPPPKFVFNKSKNPGLMDGSIVSEGTVISDSSVKNSVISNDVYVADARIVGSVILSGAVILPGSRIRNAVIDEHCLLPEGTVIGEDVSADRERFQISEEGIVLVTPEMLEALAGYNKTSVGQTYIKKNKMIFMVQN